jgi:hypothetical protein
MSKSITLDISFHKDEKYDIKNIINLLKGNGWNYIYNEKVKYLPVGDDDDFDWKNEVLTEEEIFNIIYEKEKKGEKNGLSLYWENSDLGVNLIVRSLWELSFDLCINRKMIRGKYENMTDINWYYEKLVMGFVNNNFNILSIHYEEF